MKEAAIQCASKAHYLRDKLAEAGLKQKYDAEFFNEFVTVSDADTDAIMKALDEEDILGGLPLGNGEILWCATEMNTKADIDRAAAAVASVTGKEVTA